MIDVLYKCIFDNFEPFAMHQIRLVGLTFLQVLCYRTMRSIRKHYGIMNGVNLQNLGVLLSAYPVSTHSPP